VVTSVPLTLALVAGGLSVLNPCGFPLLPAFLSFYLGADEASLPPARTRVLQGLEVGGLVALGFLGLFAVVGLPISFGVSALADAIPWAGIATGVVLAVAGLVALLGMHIPFPVVPRLAVVRERRAGAMLIFGVGYGAASLGCTLPLFLTLVGASAGGGTVTAFVAYGTGMTVVLMAISVLVALVRDGAARVVRPLLPYLGRISGLLLLTAGLYLVYYWARLHFGDTATVADDPVVRFGVTFSGKIRTFADGRGKAVIAVAGAVVVAALLSTLRHAKVARR
jgi:cytochrome c biogenesis protein CcdA